MDYLDLFRQKKKIIAIITGAFVLASLLLSLIHPLEYSASNRLLVIQPTNIALDAYSATKSVERIGEKLSEVVYTTSFYDKVMNSNFDINTEYFKKDERKKRKQWRKMVETQVVRGSGMIKLNIYHTNKAQAAQILNAITHVFHTSGWEYVGSMNIQITEVDSLLISKWPVRPNFIINGILGLIIGLIVSLIYVTLASKQFAVSQMIKRAAQSINKIDGDIANLGTDMPKQSYTEPVSVQEIVQESAQNQSEVNSSESQVSSEDVGIIDDLDDFDLTNPTMVGDADESPRRVSMQAIDLDRF